MDKLIVLLDEVQLYDNKMLCSTENYMFMYNVQNKFTYLTKNIYVDQLLQDTFLLVKDILHDIIQKVHDDDHYTNIKPFKTGCAIIKKLIIKI